MTRVLRVVTVALVLVVPVVAEAECAWVLWSQQLQSPPVPSLPDTVLATSPVAGYASKAECLTEASEIIRRSSKELTVINPMTLSLGRGNLITYSCLPDTVDPRGPKESGR